MPETRVKAPGTFCWVEVATSDVARATDFYTKLFGWTAVVAPMDQGSYTLLQLDGKEVAGLYGLPPEQTAQNIPPHWLGYILVENCDESAGKVADLGGRVLMGPMDVMEMGRMAAIQDPTGATVSLWQAKSASDAPMGVPGSPCWFELISTNKDEATAFYAGLIGWELQDWGGPMNYTLFKNGEASVAGAMQRTAEMGEVPSHWMIYMAVEDVDASAAKAAELGGQVVHPPTDIPDVGRWALIADPAGAMFAVMKLG